MYYTFGPITMSINSITIAITPITCVTASILKQCPSFPSPSQSRLSYALQLQFYILVHHHRHHVYHMHYSFDPKTMSITSIITAISFITCITASILEQCRSPSPSRLSRLLQLQSYNMSLTSITVAITSIKCIAVSIL